MKELSIRAFHIRQEDYKVLIEEKIKTLENTVTGFYKLDKLKITVYGEEDKFIQVWCIIKDGDKELYSTLEVIEIPEFIRYEVRVVDKTSYTDYIVLLFC